MTSNKFPETAPHFPNEQTRETECSFPSGHDKHYRHDGPNGYNGPIGHNGYNGHNGHTGHTGHNGHIGHIGHNGHNGHNGQNASSGAQFHFQYMMMIEMSITTSKINLKNEKRTTFMSKQQKIINSKRLVFLNSKNAKRYIFYKFESRIDSGNFIN